MLVVVDIGRDVVREPLILGQESAGRVAAVGPEAGKHAVGQRVTLEPGVPCGRCRECRAGRYNLCPDVVFFATPPVDGAFAHYVTIHEDFAFALPDELSDDGGADGTAVGRDAASTSRPSSPRTTAWTRQTARCAPESRTPTASRSFVHP